MAILSQLFTPEELARDLHLHGLSPGEIEMLRLAIADEIGKVDQRLKDALRARIRQMHAHLRPGSSTTPPKTP